MTEAEKKSFFQHTQTRAPGKRQIKPTAALLDLVLPAEDEDDDEDFVADKSLKESDGESSSSGSSSDSEEDDSDEEDEQAVDEENVEEIADVDITTEPMCALCLNLRAGCRPEEIMQCDRCGITVHDSCYLPEISEEAASTSSDSTEPWFCEPCAFGFIEPPFCELCPDRHGVFKRSDIGGKWVHIICALYTPGVTFGDIDHLGAISWQEMDHRNFGRKPCAGCTDRLEARTGVSTRCELGLCKNYFHATCAQRLGLLVDHSDEDPDITQNVEPRYINCKKHSNPDVVRERRHSYLQWRAQEDKRLLMIRRRKLTPKEEQYRLDAQRRTRELHKKLVGVTICWPGDMAEKNDQRLRRARMLHTSARFVDAFREKAELIDVDRDMFEQEFVRIRGDSLPFLPPGFSQHFVEYYNNREHEVFSAEEKRLQKILDENGKMKQRQEDLLSRFKEIEQSVHSSSEKALGSRNLLNTIFKSLSLLGASHIQLPSGFAEDNVQSRKRRSSVSSPKSSRKAARVSSVTKMELHSCSECEKSTDQHLLIHCDGCQFWYHLACLDPPLEKMPRKTNYSWLCSQCCESDGEDEKQMENEDSNDDSVRKLRQRNQITRVRKFSHTPDHISGMAKGHRKNGASEKRKSFALGKERLRSPLAKRTNETRSNNSGSTTPSQGEEDIILIEDDDDKEDAECEL